ncbi:hypothetical protein ACFX11_037978 [Malus domestica]
MPPRREPHSPAENNFLDFGQFGEAIATDIQSLLRPTSRNTLDIISRLKINDFICASLSSSFSVFPPLSPLLWITILKINILKNSNSKRKSSKVVHF